VNTAIDRRSTRGSVLLALIVGTVGGIYGVGGGSILAPILVGLGYGLAEVAPAALAATFLTSFAGVLAYAAISVGAEGDIAPDWVIGIGLGVGGLAGAALGARLQPRLPEALLRRALEYSPLVSVCAMRCWASPDYG
jgi:hypothetical protein